MAISNYIDNNIILANLSNKNFDSTRSVILELSNKFKDRILVKNLSLKDIENINDTRQRYYSLYVYYAEKRIVDTYKIEQLKLSKNPIKAFKKFLFKEKLENCESKLVVYSAKYVNLAKAYTDPKLTEYAYPPEFDGGHLSRFYR